MPVLQQHQLSTRQRRINRAASVTLPFAGVGLGLLIAIDCAKTAYGYVATYSYVAAVFFAIALVFVGLLLTLYWRTRWVGIGLMVAGVLSCGTFYGAMAVLLRLDRVAWVHERMVRIGPDQKASAVVYLRKGATAEQLEQFASSVLPDPAEPGKPYPSFVQQYLRLTPEQANGHWGIALTFFDNAPAERVRQYTDKIKSDARVATVYLDVAPASIHGSNRP